MSKLAIWVLLTLVIWPATAARAQLPEQTRDAAEFQSTVRDVLSDPEYRHLLRGPEKKHEPATDQLPQWLRDFLEWLFGRNESGHIEISEDPAAFTRLLFYAVIGILAVLLIALVVSIWVRSSAPPADDLFALPAQEEAINPSQPPGDRPVNEYERRALTAAEAGDYRSALRELVLGAMSWTERAGTIRYRRGLTNRDYVRALWRDTKRRESLLQIVAAFERVFYGRRPADEQTFDACLVEFRKSFSLEVNDAHLAG